MSNITDSPVVIRQRRHSRAETVLYVAVWTLLMALPLAMQWYEILVGQAPTWEWSKVGHAWLNMAPFLGLFLLNDLVLIPYLLDKGRRNAYIAAAVGAVVLTIFMCPLPPVHRHLPPGITPEQEMVRHRFRLIGITLFHTAMAICVVAANLAIYLYVRSEHNATRLQQLERGQLLERLQTLRYQINPHFLLNSLNNIQALVEIDPARAVTTIQILSRMLRHMLYQADSVRMVPLEEEVQFIANFTEMMRIRYPEEYVEIRLETCGETRGACMPPLLFISAVENAFKYGVSYERRSHIHISISASGGVIEFRCVNTVGDATSDAAGSGIGLPNLRRRLELIYGAGRYHMEAGCGTDGLYRVTITIPATQI